MRPHSARRLTGKALTADTMSDLDEQKPSRRLWIFAALTAVALHVGGAALAIAHLQTDEGDEPWAHRRSRSASIWLPRARKR